MRVNQVHNYVPGQRVISDAELQMGLGTVLSVEARTVTVLFQSTGDTRTYAVHSAPLTRVAFSIGDPVTTDDGRTLKITRVDEQNGLLSYHGVDKAGREHLFDESQLDNAMQLNQPAERLFNGQVDTDKWFRLRYRTQQQLNTLAHSDLFGLTGVRTSLIPHQLYIAHEVATRYAPRVLLADEVGLGKTIEAGLILHHQLLTERAHRVLIVVPETLLHQWLVEMLRRFNLHFRIFDEARVAEQQTGDEESANNPFLDEQLVLCSLEFLAASNTHFRQCLQAEWDLLVVDEAHHLQWSPQAPGHQYLLIEQLARQTPGVLLLTATPEQLGKQSHFARLRLLDPDRFPDFDAFIEEEQSYQPVAQVVEDLLNGKVLNETDIRLLEATLDEGDNLPLLEAVLEQRDNDADEQARIELVEHLLDRHGTGRVLFRNTRAAVKGFPDRVLHHYPLALPDDYRRLYRQAADTDPAVLLTPERLHRSLAGKSGFEMRWSEFDPRVEWLIDTLGRLQPHKVLVITASADTALDLAWLLKHHSGIHAAVFHEGLSIVERDKAAAFFADTETGAQVLVCSEIGSEGRNFQFAHHLILFDLPLNPDLLEQRIGRLDRIGQQHSIQIHVPCLQDCAQQIMFDWYHHALDAFEHTCPAGHAVYLQVKDALHAALHGATPPDQLIADSKQLHAAMRDALHQGRDRLLEYNSCRMHIANRLQQQAIEQDRHSTLADYMEQVFDCFAIDIAPHSENCYVIRPTEHMQSRFPGLPDDGLTITWDRDTALSFEDAQYLTWEHPLVRGAMDMVIMNEHGNTSVTAIKSRVMPAGSILLECLFIVEAAGSESLQSWRYLPATSIRIVLDENGRDISRALSHDNINRAGITVDNRTAVQVVKAKRKTLKALHKRAGQLARQQTGEILQQAHRQSDTILQREINRLKALQKLNPNVRDEEIAFFENQLAALNRIIDNASLRLDAIRAIVVT